MDTLEKIGLTIRKLRQEQKLSQEELAGRIEMDRSYLSEIESGKKNLSVVMLIRIAEGLSMKPHDLLKRSI